MGGLSQTEGAMAQWDGHGVILVDGCFCHGWFCQRMFLLWGDFVNGCFCHGGDFDVFIMELFCLYMFMSWGLFSIHSFVINLFSCLGDGG